MIVGRRGHVQMFKVYLYKINGDGSASKTRKKKGNKLLTFHA
jgi:hypothetical protein